MTIDVRTPIGLMFSVFGALLTVFGLLSDKAIYQRSLNLNVNLGWGLVLLLFGGAMLALAWRAGKAKAAAGTAPPADTSPRPANH